MNFKVMIMNLQIISVRIKLAPYLSLFDYLSKSTLIYTSVFCMQKWVIYAEYRELILIQRDFWLIKWIIWTCNCINLSKTILVFFLSKVKKTLSSVDNFFDRLLKMTLHWWMRSKKKMITISQTTGFLFLFIFFDPSLWKKLTDMVLTFFFLQLLE